MKKMIKNQEELIKTVEYIASETSRMAEKIFGKSFPISSLTVFSHSQSEFELLDGLLVEIGKPYNYNNGPRIELDKPIIVGENKIIHLRIRKPDPERPQVGCNDFDVNYEVFKNEHLLQHPQNLVLIIRPEYEMIELHDRDFDVLAYVVSV